MLSAELVKHPGFVPFLMYRWRLATKYGSRLSVKVGGVSIPRVKHATATDAGRYMATVYRNSPKAFTGAVQATLNDVRPDGQIAQFCRDALVSIAQ